MLTDTPDMTPYTGSDRERTHVVFGKAETWRTLAKVTGIKPRGLYEVGIEAVTEDPSVHTADTGVTAAPIRTSNLPRVVTIPVVSGLMARRIPGDNSRAVLAWRPAVGAVSYQIEMASGIDPSDPTVTWTRTADTTATNFVLPLFFAAQTLIRVRGIGLTAGPWVAAALGTLIPNMWNTDATAMWTTERQPDVEQLRWPCFPPSSDFTGSTVTEGQFKTALTGLRDFLSGLLGADGLTATALATLGCDGGRDLGQDRRLYRCRRGSRQGARLLQHLDADLARRRDGRGWLQPDDPQRWCGHHHHRSQRGRAGQRCGHGGRWRRGNRPCLCATAPLGSRSGPWAATSRPFVAITGTALQTNAFDSTVWPHLADGCVRLGWQ